jgi:hypothetical protein
MTHILVFLFVISFLNCLRSGFLFYKRITADRVRPIPTKELIILGISLSIIITLLICGFTI